MQRAPATIEEQLILKAIKEECPWENLPKRLQATLNSKEEWHRRIIEHCIKKRLPWNASFARKVCKEAVPLSSCRVCLSSNEGISFQILL